MRITKVTTKTGDQGDTTLGDGSHVSKDNAVYIAWVQLMN